MSAWQGFLEKQHSKRQRQQQLEAVHASWVRKRVWGAWRHCFMPLARLKHATASQAVSHWRSNVLTGSLCAWAEVWHLMGTLRCLGLHTHTVANLPTAVTVDVNIGALAQDSTVVYLQLGQF